VPVHRIDLEKSAISGEQTGTAIGKGNLKSLLLGVEYDSVEHSGSSSRVIDLEIREVQLDIDVIVLQLRALQVQELGSELRKKISQITLVHSADISEVKSVKADIDQIVIDQNAQSRKLVELEVEISSMMLKN
jgi:hypothetical protein